MAKPVIILTALAITAGIVAAGPDLDRASAATREPMVFAWCGPVADLDRAHARLVFEAAGSHKDFVDDMLADDHLTKIEQAMAAGDDVFTTLVAPARHKKQGKVLAAADVPDEVLKHLECINVRATADPLEARTPPQLRQEMGLPEKVRAK